VLQVCRRRMVGTAVNTTLPLALAPWCVDGSFEFRWPTSFGLEWSSWVRDSLVTTLFVITGLLFTYYWLLVIFFPIEQFRLPTEKRTHCIRIRRQNDLKTIRNPVGTNHRQLSIYIYISYGRDSDARWLRPQIYYYIWGIFFL